MNKGFIYTIDEDKLKEYIKLSVEEKLLWLEDINQFNNIFLTEKEKKIRNELREGRI